MFPTSLPPLTRRTKLKATKPNVNRGGNRRKLQSPPNSRSNTNESKNFPYVNTFSVSIHLSRFAFALSDKLAVNSKLYLPPAHPCANVAHHHQWHSMQTISKTRELNSTHNYISALILVSNLRVISDGKCLACTFRAKFVEVSVGINHNVDELLAGTLTQIRLKKEHCELQVITEIISFSLT
jgi:hypothetical protein